MPRVAGHVRPHWFASINSTWTSLCVREERGETVAWHGPSAPGSRNDQRSRLNPLRTRIYDLKRIARSPSIWCSSVRLTIWADYWLLTGKIECVCGLGINIVKWKGGKITLGLAFEFKKKLNVNVKRKIAPMGRDSSGSHFSQVHRSEKKEKKQK